MNKWLVWIKQIRKKLTFKLLKKEPWVSGLSMVLV